MRTERQTLEQQSCVSLVLMADIQGCLLPFFLCFNVLRSPSSSFGHWDRCYTVAESHVWSICVQIRYSMALHPVALPLAPRLDSPDAAGASSPEPSRPRCKIQQPKLTGLCQMRWAVQANTSTIQSMLSLACVAERVDLYVCTRSPQES
jgi:hypothetical protein